MAYQCENDGVRPLSIVHGKGGPYSSLDQLFFLLDDLVSLQHPFQLVLDLHEPAYRGPLLFLDNLQDEELLMQVFYGCRGRGSDLDIGIAFDLRPRVLVQAAEEQGLMRGGEAEGQY